MQWEHMKPLEPMFDSNDGRVEQFGFDIINYCNWDGPARRAIRLGCTHICTSDIAAFCIGNAWKCYRLRCTGHCFEFKCATARATRLGHSYVSKVDIASFCISNAWRCYRLRRLIACARYFHSVHLTRFIVGHIQPDSNAVNKFRCKYFEKWEGYYDYIRKVHVGGIAALDAGDQIVAWLDEENLPMIRLCARAISVWSDDKVWYPEDIEIYTYPYDREKCKERDDWMDKHGENSARYYFGDPIKIKTRRMSAKRSLRMKIFDYLSCLNGGNRLSSAMTTFGFVGNYVGEVNSFCDWGTFANCCDIPDFSTFDICIAMPTISRISFDELDLENPPDQVMMREAWERITPVKPMYVDGEWIMQRPPFTSNIGNVSRDRNGFMVEGPVFLLCQRFVKVVFEPDAAFYNIGYCPLPVGNIPMNDWVAWREDVKKLFTHVPREQNIRQCSSVPLVPVMDDWVCPLQEKATTMGIECAKYDHIEVYQNGRFLFFRCKYLDEYGHCFTELNHALNEYASSEFKTCVMRKIEHKHLEDVVKKQAYLCAKKERRKISDAKFRVWADARKKRKKRKRVTSVTSVKGVSKRIK